MNNEKKDSLVLRKENELTLDASLKWMENARKEAVEY